jgi:hypothetical protein
MRLCLVPVAVLALAFAAGCEKQSDAEAAKELAKEIPKAQNTNTGFSDKMAKYKIGGPGSPPGMQAPSGLGGPKMLTKGDPSAAKPPAASGKDATPAVGAKK